MDPFTDEKIAELAIAAGMDAMEGEDDDGPRMYWEGWDHQLIAFARALRPVPVSVSERLPGPEDCDAEGRCWFFISSLGGYDDDWGWKLLDRTYGASQCQTTWMPHWALSLPVADTEEAKGND